MHISSIGLDKYIKVKQIPRTYKYRLKPTEQQRVFMEKHFGCTRFIYNHFLSERKRQYDESGKSDRFYEQCKALTELKKQPDTAFLNEVNSNSLVYSLRCLDNAYQNFFKHGSGFPRFKSKNRLKDSFTSPQPATNKIKGNKLYIPKFKEGIECIVSREIKGEVRTVTISKTPTGKYFAAILTLEQIEPKEKTGAVIGVDLGIKDFAITNEGTTYPNNKYTKKYSKKLATAQKHLSRKKKGSNSFESQKRKVARIHEKIANARKDNLHKVSTQLIDEYDLIAIEDLNVKGMVKNHKLAKSISDMGWGMFVEMLQYKANWYDKQVVKIDRFYPSSKTCSECGWKNKDLSLSDREWKCGGCGTVVDRDVNAAQNILEQGLKKTSGGSLDNTDGGEYKTSKEFIPAERLPTKSGVHLK